LSICHNRWYFIDQAGWGLLQQPNDDLVAKVAAPSIDLF
jgi:hypothetical protein